MKVIGVLAVLSFAVLASSACGGDDGNTPAVPGGGAKTTSSAPTTTTVSSYRAAVLDAISKAEEADSWLDNSAAYAALAGTLRSIQPPPHLRFEHEKLAAEAEALSSLATRIDEACRNNTLNGIRKAEGRPPVEGDANCFGQGFIFSGRAADLRDAAVDLG